MSEYAFVNAIRSIRALVATAGKTMPLWSTYDNVNDVYTWNTDCWLAPLGNLLTCISPAQVHGDDTRSWRNGAFITPQDIVTVNHITFWVGQTVKAVAADGTVYTRTVTANRHIAGSPSNTYVTGFLDVNVAHLDSPLPAGIVPVKLLPADWRRWIPEGTSRTDMATLLPGDLLQTDVHGAFYQMGGFRIGNRKNGVCTVNYIGRASIAYGYWDRDRTYSPSFWVPDYPGDMWTWFPRLTATAFEDRYHEIVQWGDSGSPAFLVIDGQLVLIQLVSDTLTSGDGLVDVAAEINAAIADMGGTDVVSTIDLSGFDELPPNPAPEITTPIVYEVPLGYFSPETNFMLFTNFYCTAAGSNLNAGSTLDDAAIFTGANGAWDGTTFTLANTASLAGVAIGMYASICLDAATEAVFVVQITGVDNGAHTITTGTVKAGTAPANGANGRTIKVGGAWLGPNAASAFPTTLVTSVLAADTTHPVRVFMKTCTTSAAYSSSAYVRYEGYTTTPGDGGMAVLSSSAAGTSILASTGARVSFVNIELRSTAVNGSTTAVASFATGAGVLLRNFAVSGATGTGVGLTSTQPLTIEGFESYNNGGHGVVLNEGSTTYGTVLKKFIIHDNGADGINLAANSNPSIVEGILDRNALAGLRTVLGANKTLRISHVDFFNNGLNPVTPASPDSGIVLAEGGTATIDIADCRFVTNANYGISRTSTTVASNISVRNCGFFGNGVAETTGLCGEASGNVSYASNPFAGAGTGASPRGGDFTPILSADLVADNWILPQSASYYSSATPSKRVRGAVQVAVPSLTEIAQAAWSRKERTLTT